MARSQPKPAPKPLPIRGDRLLLALDALETMVECPVRGMRPMRVRRSILRVLNRLLDEGCPELAHAYGQLDRDGTLRLMLRTGWYTTHVTFDARGLIDRVRAGPYPRVHECLEQFFTAVACGVLTEADFRERSTT